MKVLEDGIGKIESLEAAFSECFPYTSLSAASADFSSLDVTADKNEKVAKAVTTVLDAITSITQDSQTVATFLHLHIPKMEDGNNFGVTVQLSLLKEISDLQEAVTKGVDDLSGYHSARAEALSKLSLPSTSGSVTKSTSVTTTDGKQEDKTSETKEEKKATNDTSGPVYAARVSALVAVDTLYYAKAQRIFQSNLTLYLATLDFFDKNKDKLEMPKGAGGARASFHSMY
jgi:hypothetical protein